MSTTVFNSISRGHGVGIFAKSEGMGVYPENYRLRDTAACRGSQDVYIRIPLYVHIVFKYRVIWLNKNILVDLPKYHVRLCQK